ncbi:MAG: sulfite exporter TauE/SafE family protein [Ruminococcaceae bacterium]|nr:sulfite exporter TauE/SafE family protein [Oscillospiraceae bacterium]
MIDTEQLLIIFLITAVGGFIQRVTGFGFGIFVMLFFPHIFKTHTSAAAISTFVSSCISAYNAFIYRKNIPYKSNVPLVLSALITIPVAVRLSILVSGDYFNKALGVVLIILSVYFLFFSDRIKIKPSVKNGIISGGIAGILTGLFSTGGPPVVLYLVNAFSDNLSYFASTQFFFGLTGIYSTIVRAFSGIINSEVLVFSAVGFVGSIVGNLFGKSVFDKLNKKRLRQIIYIGMIISGIIMIV